MKKPRFLFPFYLVIIILFIVTTTVNLYAGQAGVGVINVPPKYGYIKVEQQNDLIRVYLTISDYNSWGDISQVSVTLDNNGDEFARFLFNQYQDDVSFEPINEFTEIPDTNQLLLKEKCSYEKSNASETIDDRCDLIIRFVFRKTMFTGIRILIQDRAGSDPAEAYLSYNTEETARSSTLLVIPWIGNPIIIEIPPFLIDILALLCACAITMYYLKKKGLLTKIRRSHEKTT